MFHDRSWLQDFDALPHEKQAEVIDFIQFLKSRKVQLNSVSAGPPSSETVQSSDDPQKAAFLERAKDLIGIVDDAPIDLATHPKHFQGFGE